MISAAFIFTQNVEDDAFLALDALVQEAAEATPGYVGREAWRSAEGGVRNSTYYWESRTALGAFARHPAHVEAKRRYAEWYGGFHVVISEVLSSYGDGGIDTVLPDARAARRRDSGAR